MSVPDPIYLVEVRARILVGVAPQGVHPQLTETSSMAVTIPALGLRPARPAASDELRPHDACEATQPGG